jgi:hypothetical protein
MQIATTLRYLLYPVQKKYSQVRPQSPYLDGQSHCPSCYSAPSCALNRGHTILTSRELMWYYECIWDILTLNSGADSQFSQLCLRHVIWRGALVGSRASTPLKFLLSYTFRETWLTCRVLFRHCYQLFLEMGEMLIENCANGPFYMSPSHQIVEINIWEPTHGKK